MSAFFVDPDIRRAETLPADFYRDPVIFDQMASRILPVPGSGCRWASPYTTLVKWPR